MYLGAFVNFGNIMMIEMRMRKIMWKDAIGLSEDDFKDKLIKHNSKYSNLLPIQTTYGKIIDVDEVAVTVCTEENEDKTPRDIVIIPISIIVKPTQKELKKMM